MIPVTVNKADNIFLKVISDEYLASTFNLEPQRYRSIDEGKRSLNPYVKAIAEIIDQLNKKISSAKSEMHIRNQVGPVVLDESEFSSIYKKIVSSLSK